jgi:hypothetical protein
MNKITKLFEADFVKELFLKDLVPIYPDATGIGNIEIVYHKKNVWDMTYHVVVEYRIQLEKKGSEPEAVNIFCTAHSSEPREKVFTSLSFLHAYSFCSDKLTVPRALFYSKHFNATFYQGVVGHNLYHYIKDNNFIEIEKIVEMASAWFAKLHALRYETASHFLEEERVTQVVPGYRYVLKKIKERQPAFLDKATRIYDHIKGCEKNFLRSTKKRWLIHGDAHPENIIKTGTGKLAVIDFTDLCLSDFARDLGAFSQQFEYMCINKIPDQIFVQRIKDNFLEKYLEYAKIKMDENLESRIKNYYNWSAFRTAIFHLTGHLNKPDRAEPLVNKILENINIGN